MGPLGLAVQADCESLAGYAAEEWRADWALLAACTDRELFERVGLDVGLLYWGLLSWLFGISVLLLQRLMLLVILLLLLGFLLRLLLLKLLLLSLLRFLPGLQNGLLLLLPLLLQLPGFLLLLLPLLFELLLRLLLLQLFLFLPFELFGFGSGFLLGGQLGLGFGGSSSGSLHGLAWAFGLDGIGICGFVLGGEFCV